jgi:hypothetical protein
MSFFELPDPLPPPEPQERFDPPDWMGPPRAVLPGYSPQQAVIFKTDLVALVVHRFLAYPTGVAFTLSLWNNDPDSEMMDVPWEHHGRPRMGRSTRDVLPDELLRLGALFDDGTKWTNIDHQHFSHQEEPDGPIVVGRGGGGGGSQWEFGFWMWPLPPGDVVTFVTEWPMYGISDSRACVNASELRNRAADSQPIWPE